ncbi:TraR/DksA family transcriptional regulator [Streptomyces sp. NPDC014889]|uniref:TraR/DksA family transcriptional regulator n=1 Tax=Streptomyces sp. NPDC014889 TaxID=3364928 RepID=UPI0036F818FE
MGKDADAAPEAAEKHPAGGEAGARAAAGRAAVGAHGGRQAGGDGAGAPGAAAEKPGARSTAGKEAARKVGGKGARGAVVTAGGGAAAGDERAGRQGGGDGAGAGADGAVVEEAGTRKAGRKGRAGTVPDRGGGAGDGDSVGHVVAPGVSGAGAGRKRTAKKAGAARAAKQTGATTVVAKKTPGTAAAAKTAVPKARIAAAVDPGDLPVRPGEDPWTLEEVSEARAELESEMERLSTEITSSEESLAGLMRDSGDGAGDDEADTGSKNITREHEMALAANAREMLTQTERALQRLDAGTYGLCENCGNPIGKARMQAFPRATLCVECKQKQERRY